MIDLTRIWPFGLSRRTWPFFAAGFVVVLLVVIPFDHPISVLATGQSRDVVSFFNELTRWGMSDWILIPSGTLLALTGLAAWLVPRRLPKLVLIEMTHTLGFIFVGVGLPGLVSNLLKRIVGRGRPELFDTVGTLSFHPLANTYVYEGFPSGHSTTSFAAAMVLGFLAPRWYGVGLVFAVSILASRVIVGAHYPTDVLAGMVLGTLGAYWVRQAFATRRWGFERRPDGRIVPRQAAATARLMRRFQRK